MENQNNDEKKRNAKKIGGMLFTGCMFLGMAIGWYTHSFTIGLFGGIGVGFIMSAVVWASINSIPIREF